MRKSSPVDPNPPFLQFEGKNVRGFKMIPTFRRIEYATGFVELGLLEEASEELELIEG